MLPLFFLAMYEKHGQGLEKIVGNILKGAVIRPKQRPYQTNNFYAVLKRQEMLDKEVYDLSLIHISQAGSFDEFSSLLLREGVTVKESRGRLSYLTDRKSVV